MKTTIKSVEVTKKKQPEEPPEYRVEPKEVLEEREKFFEGYPHYNIGNPPQ